MSRFASCRAGRVLVAGLLTAGLVAPGCAAGPARGVEPPSVAGPEHASAGDPAPRAASGAKAAAGAGPRLIRNGPRWAVTGLSPDAAAAVEQGRLFVVQRPTPGTSDSSPVAVFRALGPPNGSTVDVAEQCTALDEEVTPGLSAAPLGSSTDKKVGACLARIVGEGVTGAGERYVRLDVGTGHGLRAGDRYRILGRSVNAAGYVPLGLASADDGRCMIDDDPTQLGINIALCVVLALPRGKESLANGFAVFVPRP